VLRAPGIAQTSGSNGERVSCRSTSHRVNCDSHSQHRTAAAHSTHGTASGCSSATAGCAAHRGSVEVVRLSEGLEALVEFAEEVAGRVGAAVAV